MDEKIDSSELDNCGDLGGEEKIKSEAKKPPKRETREDAKERHRNKFVDSLMKNEPKELAAFRKELEDRVKAIVERSKQDWATYNQLRAEGLNQEAADFVFGSDKRKQQESKTETNESAPLVLLEDDN